MSARKNVLKSNKMGKLPHFWLHCDKLFLFCYLFYSSERFAVTRHDNQKLSEYCHWWDLGEGSSGIQAELESSFIPDNSWKYFQCITAARAVVAAGAVGGNEPAYLLSVEKEGVRNLAAWAVVVLIWFYQSKEII